MLSFCGVEHPDDGVLSLALVMLVLERSLACVRVSPLVLDPTPLGRWPVEGESVGEPGM